MKPFTLLFALLFCGAFKPIIAQERMFDREVREIFQVVEEMPLFPGCEDVQNKKEREQCARAKMNAFVKEHKTYPKIAKDNGVEGTTVIRFIVNKAGKIEEPTIVRDIGAQCGKEALRIVGLMPNWNPGKQRGKPVDVYYNMPVKFSMEEERKKEEAPISPTNTKLNADNKAIDYQELDEKPTFSGCETIEEEQERLSCAQVKMLQFTYKSVRYPPQARKRSTEGTVIVRFTIGADGVVKDPSIVQGIGDGCDEEVIRIINNMPLWNPGKVGGKAVPSYYTLPVKFKLE